MGKFHLFPLLRTLSSGGLTLVEVMVGMMVSSLFLSTALQAYVSAVSIKATSQKTDVAIATIRSDSETIRQVAQEVPTAAVDCKENPGRAIIAQVNTGDVETLNGISNPQPDWSVGPIVQDEERQVIEQSTILPIRDASEYQFRRILQTDSDNAVNPSHLLHIFYEVTYLSANAQIGDGAAVQPKTVAKLRTSVMPNAVLVCP